MADAKATLEKKLQAEHDPNVRQNLQIMIKAADAGIQGSALRERLLLPWTDAPQLVFSGLQGLLSEPTPPHRRARALNRHEASLGMAPGTAPHTPLQERTSDVE